MEKRTKNIKKRLQAQAPEKQRDKGFSSVNVFRHLWKEDWNYPLFPLYCSEVLRWDDCWFQHVDYQFIAVELLLEGTVKYEFDGKSFIAAAGDCFVILPHSNVRIVNALGPGQARRNLVLLLGGSAPYCLARLLGFENDTLLKLSAPEAVEQKMRMIAGMIAGKSSHRQAAAASYELMLLLAGEYRRLNGVLPEDMLRVKNYFCENYASDISIESVASLAGMSAATLRRKFQHYFGVTPLKYLTELRLSQAAVLLRSFSCSIKETGFACGFNSALYFTESFRRRFGCTPRQFRQKYTDHS